MIHLIIGRSGSGKSSICQELEKYGYKTVKSFTTRPRRNGEGDIYHFITEAEYSAIKNKIAPVFFNGYHYCSSIEEINSSDFYIAEPSATRELRILGIDYDVFYIAVDKNTAIKRMQKRGDSEEKIASRVKNDDKDFGEHSIANPKIAKEELGEDKIFYFHNKDLEKCVSDILLHLKEKKNESWK